MIGLGRFWSVAISAWSFSRIGHWSGGAANILIAFAAGSNPGPDSIYWRVAILVANMIGHKPGGFSLLTSCQNCFS